MKKRQPVIDPLLKKYYSESNEKDRLSLHRLEKDRTLRILRQSLPPAPAVILDVGGAAGVYAFPLAEMGYEVHLTDPIPLHIDQANEENKNTEYPLASISNGDARKIDRADQSADVVLFFGPLYHLIEQKDRIKALKEAFRVLKSGGLLFAVGISRFASFMDAIHKGVVDSKFKVIETDLETGVHRKLVEDLIFAYLHRAKELEQEIVKSRFEKVTIRAIEGPVWERQAITSLQQDPVSWEKLLTLLDQIDREETIIGASAHIMAIARK